MQAQVKYNYNNILILIIIIINIIIIIIIIIITLINNHKQNFIMIVYSHPLLRSSHLQNDKDKDTAALTVKM